MLLQINPSESWGHSQEVVVTDNVRSLAGLLREISAAIEWTSWASRSMMPSSKSG
jgi:hypothetical protein